MHIIAHRGIHGELPENSLAAIGFALDKGLGVEFDVHMSADGEIVLLHDTSLNRTTTGNGKVGDYSYDELQDFSLKDKDGNATDHGIPTLTQILDYAAESGPNGLINIELKGDHTAKPVCNLVTKYIEEGKIPEEQFLLSSILKFVVSAHYSCHLRCQSL